MGKLKTKKGVSKRFKQAMKDKNIDRIKKETEELTKVSHKLAEEIYKNTRKPSGLTINFCQPIKRLYIFILSAMSRLQPWSY